ncbi:jg6462, partial [Pararge aegeria aegeria]
ITDSPLFRARMEADETPTHVLPMKRSKGTTHSIPWLPSITP